MDFLTAAIVEALKQAEVRFRYSRLFVGICVESTGTFSKTNESYFQLQGIVECPRLARTYRQSHLLTMSGVPPTPDLRARMSGNPLFSSGLPPGSEVPGTVSDRGVLTQPGHL
jgi:hypothetical protein